LGGVDEVLLNEMMKVERSRHVQVVLRSN